MPLRNLARLALHLVLVASMSLAGVVAPVVAAQEAIASLPAPAVPAVAMDMPCDHMDAMQQAPATDPCAKAHCSLAACLGAAACLPAMARVSAHVPVPDRFVTIDVLFVPSRVLETPLRPPIA
ncbi:hypothetical protein LYSHEL_07110 [Lysobacter helvus]|uniref:CopL family metal-binding regulatory protein n=2 Tax=Lysobacteraceae TaxID=32033 RepID=A0ABN6FPY9_9GAMM|nr:MULTISPECIES: hypothetical protein [Lysobacter]BCT91687.1 hypothetical protein LYSCAS_07110 [Lysobacter caseinilyticus]BCT94840.1 hypothetical protein LYSHEL_07110 [Lysobacter helvus]